MEENVALDSKKQKKFVKSIIGIKKLIKKNEKLETKSEPKKKDEQTKPVKPFSMRLKDPKIGKKNRKERGLVYLSHIPHGFYEHQMTQYFKQFGVVTNARVIRSQRTGNSKGFAFVEFKEPSVAQIVAETMNNYLMGKRLIKAAYIPPEKQKRKAFRKHWNTVHNPTSVRRLKLKKAFNTNKDEAGDLKKARKLLSRLQKTKKRLTELGINYDFFTPVDVPEALLDRVIKKENDDTVKETVETKSKKGKKEKVEPKEEKVDIKGNKNNKNGNKPNEKGNKNNKNENKPNETNKKGKQEDKKEVPKVNKNDSEVTKKQEPAKVNEKQQKEKEQKLKTAGVKSVEEFISLDADDSDDESVNFDSDEYEKMIGEDDEFSSSEGSADESGDDEEDSDGDEEDIEGDEESIEEEELPAPKKGKGQPPKVLQPIKPKKQAPQKQQPQKPQPKKQEFKLKNEAKRKSPQKPPVAAKKAKFEKQSQKPMKKQFKKK